MESGPQGSRDALSAFMPRRNWPFSVIFWRRLTLPCLPSIANPAVLVHVFSLSPRLPALCDRGCNFG
jgi:hypothetical protein